MKSDKLLKWGDNLNEHMVIHTDKKTYKDCIKTFIDCSTKDTWLYTLVRKNRCKPCEVKDNKLKVNVINVCC